MNKLFILVAVIFTAVGYGEQSRTNTNTAAPTASPQATAPVVTETTASAPATTATDATRVTAAQAVTAPSDARIIGDIELRPTWESKTGNFTTENELMLGYQFTKDTSLAYYQYINSNLYTRGPGEGGLGLAADDGFVRAKVNNVWRSGDTYLNYEFRGITPVSQSSRDKGMIAGLQNRFKLNQDFGKTLTIAIHEIPVIPVFSRAGTDLNGVPTANPGFENRVYLIGTVNFTDSLSLDIPFLFYQTRNRDYSAAAARNDDWTFTLIAWPELTYSIDANLAVGAAFRSSNLLNNGADATSFQVGDGLESGVTQVFLRAIL